MRHRSSLMLMFGFTQSDLDCGRTIALADHRLQIWAAFVLRPVGVVDPVVDRPVHLVRIPLLSSAGGGDSPSFLLQGSLVPTGSSCRCTPVRTARHQRLRTRSRWSTVRLPVFAERRDVQVVSRGNLMQFVFDPFGHVISLPSDCSGVRVVRAYRALGS